MGTLTRLTGILMYNPLDITKTMALLFIQEDPDIVVTGRTQKLGPQMAEEIQRARAGCNYKEASHALMMGNGLI
jgi:hypothetical protein